MCNFEIVLHTTSNSTELHMDLLFIINMLLLKQAFETRVGLIGFSTCREALVSELTLLHNA